MSKQSELEELYDLIGGVSCTIETMQTDYPELDDDLSVVLASIDFGGRDVSKLIDGKGVYDE